MESSLEQEKKKRELGHRGFDVRFADELASGLRSGTSSHEQFLRAVGESRLVVKKEREVAKKMEENEFVKKTQENHEKKVKIELKTILGKKKVALPTSEPIFGKKKRKKDEGSGPEKDEREEKETWGTEKKEKPGV